MLIVCTGTATEIGKTWVGAAVLAGLRSRGVDVSVRKPVQSFDPRDLDPTDRDILAAATGEDPDTVCPPGRSYPLAYAPPMAAAALGLAPVRLADLLADLRWPDVAVRWVEGVGGVRSPLADDGDTVDLCAHVVPDVVVLVAHAGLGTINDVALAVDALAGHAVLVVLNRFDAAQDLHVRNRDWLAERRGLHVITDPDALVAILSELAATSPGGVVADRT